MIGLEAAGNWVWLEKTLTSGMSDGHHGKAFHIDTSTAMMVQAWELPHRIVSIGSRADTKGAEVGDLVTIEPYCGSRVTRDGVEYVYVKDEQLVARVPEELKSKVVCDARGEW